jgi:hypothetical protein
VARVEWNRRVWQWVQQLYRTATDVTDAAAPNRHTLLKRRHCDLVTADPPRNKATLARAILGILLDRTAARPHPERLFARLLIIWPQRT